MRRGTAKVGQTVWLKGSEENDYQPIEGSVKETYEDFVRVKLGNSWWSIFEDQLHESKEEVVGLMFQELVTERDKLTRQLAKNQKNLDSLREYSEDGGTEK